MRLPFLRPKTEAEPSPATGAARGRRPPPPVGDVEQARTHARRRLMGAGVLLAVGVVAFPLLFENEPRPLPMDIPIELPPGMAQAPAAGPRPGRPLPVISVPADAGNESSQAMPAPAPPPAAVASTPGVATAVVVPPRLAATAEPSSNGAGGAKTVGQASRPGDDARAPKAPAAPPSTPSPSAAAGARYVVQVGAYVDGPTLRATRERVEKLGLKTYTQVIETAAGKRTRVRLGPFATRDEADAAAARLKRAGLPGSILTL